MRPTEERTHFLREARLSVKRARRCFRAVTERPSEAAHYQVQGVAWLVIALAERDYARGVL